MTDTATMDDSVREFLAAPNPAVIATLRPDGHPSTVATWYLLDGDRILVNMASTRKRLEWLRADPRVSLTVLDAASWYTHLSLKGRVVELRDDPDLADIDRLARQYGMDRYADREGARVSAWIEVERVHGWGGQRR